MLYYFDFLYFLYPKYPPPPSNPNVIIPANGFDSSVLLVSVLLVTLLAVLFALVVDIFAIVLSIGFVILIFIVLVFPFELVAVISTVPYFFATTSPVSLTVAILDFQYFHLFVFLLRQ